MSTVFSQDRQFEWCVRPIIQIYRSCVEDILKYFFQALIVQRILTTNPIHFPDDLLEDRYLSKLIAEKGLEHCADLSQCPTMQWENPDIICRKHRYVLCNLSRQLLWRCKANKERIAKMKFLRGAYPELGLNKFQCSIKDVVKRLQ